MRRKLSLFLVCLLSLLTACGQKEPVDTDWTPKQMVQAILDTQDTATVTPEVLNYEDPLFDTYISDYYGLDPGDVADGAITYAGGVSALEIAVLRLADNVNAKDPIRILDAYIDARAGAFAGYAPEEYAILESSGTTSRGQYIALLICPTLDSAEKAFASCFTSNPPQESPPDPQTESAPDAAPQLEPDPPDSALEDPAEEPAEPLPSPEPTEPEQAAEPPFEAGSQPDSQPDPQPEPAPEPQEPWGYDEQRILDAWNSGSREGLWEQDLAILSSLEGIPALTDSSLTDYQRELALHDWMIAWAEYDPGALSSGPIGEPMPDNDNPYGFLTGGKGICLGYTRTFQLLMDLSGIECVSVNGMAHAGTAEHAWNLVRLDGEWYAVDTTWDDPIASFQVPEATAHMYFNVTDNFLRQHDHQWDEDSVPEATGTTWIWG